MNDGGSGENWKYSRLVRNGWKIRNTEGLGGKDARSVILKEVGRDERLKILKVRWKGWKIRNTQG